MIDSVRRTRSTFAALPDFQDLEGLHPNLSYAVSLATPLQAMGVTYQLTLSEGRIQVLELQAEYQVQFSEKAAPDAQLAQEVTWPYLRMHFEDQLAAQGVTPINVLPVLNPFGAQPELQPVDTPAPPPEAQQDRPLDLTWNGVFPERFEAVMKLTRTLHEIAQKRRQWLFSALRVYSALLLADRKRRKGVSIEVIKSSEDAFQAFFEQETGVPLKTWGELEDVDKRFCLKLARELVIVTLDAVQEDEVDPITAEIQDDYMQRVDDSLEEVFSDQVSESLNWTPLHRENRWVDKKAFEVRKKYPLPAPPDVGMQDLFKYISMYGQDSRLYDDSKTDESIYIYYWTDKNDGAKHYVRFVKSEKQNNFSFCIDIEIYDDYSDWSVIGKEYVQYGSFPSLERYRRHRVEQEKAPPLAEEHLDDPLPDGLESWLAHLDTMRELNSVLTGNDSDVSTNDLLLLAQTRGVDLSLIGSQPNAPLHLLEQLFQNEDHRARSGVAKNPLTPAEWLSQLSNDQVRDVRASAASNPTLPESEWPRLAEDAWQVQAQLASNLQLSPALMWQLAHGERLEVREALALNENAPAELLDYLANDAEPSVRIYVSTNSATLMSTLERLSHDQIEALRAFVRAQLEGRQQAP